MQQKNFDESQYTSIGFELQNLSFDMLRKKRAFLNGADVDIMPVRTEKFDKKRRPVYSSFHPIGDVLPIQARGNLATAEDYSRLFAAS